MAVKATDMWEEVARVCVSAITQAQGLPDAEIERQLQSCDLQKPGQCPKPMELFAPFWRYVLEMERKLREEDGSRFSAYCELRKRNLRKANGASDSGVFA